MRGRATLRSGALAVIACATLWAAGCRRFAPATSTVYAPGAPVFIISIDTLRADHLPAFGYKRVETPAIDSLRADGILFRNAYSHVPLTFPSHVSMLTGLLPPDNGVRNNIGYRFDVTAHASIPRLLEQRGYATGAAVSAFVLRGDTGLREAFDFYDDAMDVQESKPIGYIDRSGFTTEAVAESWIDAHGKRPLFFFLHLFEPHAPYVPPEPFKSRFAAPYDGEIATADAIVGKFIRHLKSAGLYDKALIILMSDHGEGLGDHAEQEHGIFLYREDLHVPIILKLPGNAMARSAVDAPAQLIDILPTITSITGATTPKEAKGTSLLALANVPDRGVYSETLYPRIHLGWSDLRSIINRNDHYIEAPKPELYDVARDPRETSNILDQRRRVYGAMRKELERYPRNIGAPSHVSAEDRAKLAALGYLTANAVTDSGPLGDPKDHIGELTAFNQAVQLEQAGRYAEAVRIYRALTERNPRFTDAWTRLSKSCEEMGRYSDAIDSYKAGIRASPSLAGEFALSMARDYLNLGDAGSAAKHAQLGIEVNPASAHLLLGRAALASGDPARAVAEARIAAADRTFHVAGVVLLAQAEVRLDPSRMPEALAMIEEAGHEVSARKGAPVALLDFVRGDILARSGRTSEAKASFEQEIANFPRDREAYASLAVLQWLEGDHGAADRTMQRLVRAVPETETYAFISKTYRQIGDTAAANRWLRGSVRR